MFILTGRKLISLLVLQVTQVNDQSPSRILAGRADAGSVEESWVHGKWCSLRNFCCEGRTRLKRNVKDMYESEKRL